MVEILNIAIVTFAFEWWKSERSFELSPLAKYENGEYENMLLLCGSFQDLRNYVVVGQLVRRLRRNQPNLVSDQRRKYQLLQFSNQILITWARGYPCKYVNIR